MNSRPCLALPAGTSEGATTAGASGTPSFATASASAMSTPGTRASAVDMLLSSACLLFDIGLVERQGRYTYGLVFQVSWRPPLRPPWLMLRRSCLDWGVGVPADIDTSPQVDQGKWETIGPW